MKTSILSSLISQYQGKWKFCTKTDVKGKIFMLKNFNKYFNFNEFIKLLKRQYNKGFSSFVRDRK